MSAENPRQRPFKVWSADRSVRKGVIAGSLADLVRKGKMKLEFQEAESVAVVLECDGTEVDDEYFRRLDENTIILLLKIGERWYPPGVEAIRAVPPVGCVEGTHAADVTDDASVEDSRFRKVGSLLPSLRQNLSATFLLSVDELELLSEMDVERHSMASSHRESEMDFLRRLRDTCCRILEERREAKEAMELLQVLGSFTREGDQPLPKKKARIQSEGPSSE